MNLHKENIHEVLGSGGVVVHNDFLYVMGLQRCGTNSTQQLLMQNFKNLSQYRCRCHMPIRFCNEQELQVSKILGNIRNPFSFYLSYYQYHLTNKRQPLHILQEWFPNYHITHNFKQTLYNLLFKLEWPTYANLTDGYRYRTEQTWQQNNKLNVGLFTTRYINIFFKDAVEILNTYDNKTFMDCHDELITVNSICKLENLKGDISKYINISTTSDIEIINESKEYSLLSMKDIMTNYDEEMIEWVRTRDSIFFEKYYRD